MQEAVVNTNYQKFTIPKLYKPQIDFFKSEYHYTLYGGSRGGGKSFVVRFKAIALALQYQGIRILILRRTFPELQANHIDTLRSVLKCGSKNELATFNAKEAIFRFPNGSVIKMGHCHRDSDIDHYQGQQYEAIFIDEGTHFTEKMFNYFKMINRPSDTASREVRIRPRMYITANPGGVGHQWVKRLFIDRDFRDNEDPNDYHFIPSTVYDNTFLMESAPEYVKQLESLPEKERQAMLLGDWTVFEGQFFEEFDEAVHTYESGEIKFMPHWNWYRTRDYGLDMLDCLWFCIDDNGTMYFEKEIAVPNLTVSASGRLINEMTLEHEKPILDIAPPDLWNRQRETGRSASTILRDECNQILTRANNDRVSGCMFLKEKLQINPQTGKPYLMINAERCKNLIYSIKMIQHSDTNPNVYATEPHNLTHAVDALRYGVTSYTFAPELENLANISRKFNFSDWALNSGVYYQDDDDNDDNGGFII